MLTVYFAPCRDKAVILLGLPYLAMNVFAWLFNGQASPTWMIFLLLVGTPSLFRSQLTRTLCRDSIFQSHKMHDIGWSGRRLRCHHPEGVRRHLRPFSYLQRGSAEARTFLNRWHWTMNAWSKLKYCCTQISLQSCKQTGSVCQKVCLFFKATRANVSTWIWGGRELSCLLSVS